MTVMLRGPGGPRIHPGSSACKACTVLNPCTIFLATKECIILRVSLLSFIIIILLFVVIIIVVFYYFISLLSILFFLVMRNFCCCILFHL